jgi:hypothetical protein
MLVRMWGKRNPCALLVGMQACTTTLEKICRLLKKLNVDLPYDPAIPLLGIYQKECDSGYSRGTCTPMFITVLFTIAKLWKQSRCSTTDEWIKSFVTLSHIIKCGIYTQWSFTQPWRRMKSYHLQVNGWNSGISSWARLARLRRPKIVCSPSYVDFRSRAKAVMLLDLGHTLRGEQILEAWG